MAIILFGKRKTPIEHVEEILLKCPSCERDAFADVMVYSEYFHLYFLPMWPVGKEAVSYCKTCGIKRVLPVDKDYPGNYIEIKEKFKHRFFVYTGISIISLIIICAIVSAQFK